MFECRLVRRGYGTHTYEVKGAQGMTKEEILNKCDYNNFGGVVYVGADGCGTVEVYVD